MLKIFIFKTFCFFANYLGVEFWCCFPAIRTIVLTSRKHLYKHDQNIFEGLSRVIVYHLERQEIAESLPYIETAWERLQKIPGKDSFDFHVVDKIRSAVRTTSDFRF